MQRDQVLMAREIADLMDVGVLAGAAGARRQHVRLGGKDVAGGGALNAQIVSVDLRRDGGRRSTLP